MRSIYVSFLLMTLALGVARAGDSFSHESSTEGPAGPRAWHTTAHEFRNGETFAGVLRPLGVVGAESHTWFRAVADHFPASKLIGEKLFLYFEHVPDANRPGNLRAIQIESKPGQLLSWTLAGERIAFARRKTRFATAAPAVAPVRPAPGQPPSAPSDKSAAAAGAAQNGAAEGAGREHSLASVERVTHVIRRGETLAAMFQRLAVPPREAQQWFRAIASEYSVRALTPGRKVVFYFATSLDPDNKSRGKKGLRALQIETRKQALLTWQKEQGGIAYRGKQPQNAAAAGLLALPSHRVAADGAARNGNGNEANGGAPHGRNAGGGPTKVVKLRDHASNGRHESFTGRYPSGLRKLPLSEYTLARVKQRNGLWAHTHPQTGHRPVASLKTLRRARNEIGAGDNLLGILRSYGLSKEEEQEWLQSIQSNYVAEKLQSGALVHVYFTHEQDSSEEHDPPIFGRIKALEIELPAEKILTWYRSEHGILFYRSEPEYDVEVKAVAGTIADGSLYEAAARVGLHPAAIEQLVDIFGWDLNFETDLMQGDTFSVLYARRYLPGSRQPSQIRVLAAQIVNRGQTHMAIYFENANGTGDYYDVNGRTLSRSLLRYPVDFLRISSNFSRRRYHPILRVRKPHRGVDFAAKRGTPVKTIGNGTVTYAAWKGAYGRFIEIDHGGGLKTRYAHLHRIAKGIRPGAQVQKGQIIGSVGCSGRCTGPHLHFEMWENERYVNPLKPDLPPDDELDPTVFRIFEEAKASFLSKLTSEPNAPNP